jgi:hypothetical protein
MESGYAYPERSDDNPATSCANVEAETGVRTKNSTLVLSEVSRGRSRPETSTSPNRSGQDAGLTQGRRTEC